MNHFAYRNGVLYAEDVPVAEIAAQVGTPFYCYSTATLTRHYTVFADALAGMDATICYAVKANSNLAVIRTLADLGAGADVVSEGELFRALAAGVPPDRIVFSGVGKEPRELALALDKDIRQINVESDAELDLLSALATTRGKVARIALRVNPDVDANTHAKITTGRKENKFGIEWTRAHQVLRRAMDLPGIAVAGIAVHIGSQLTELQPFRDAFRRVRDLVLMLRADGIPIDHLDLGGGLGIPYHVDSNHQESGSEAPSPAAYAAVARQALGDLGCRLVFEPGRLIVGNAGILVARIIAIKEGATRTFVICDAAMNDLIRPAMYDAHHEIIPVNQPPADAVCSLKDVVGPICETGDTFARQRSLPPLAGDDLIAFLTAGAYGAVMSSTYNTRQLVPEVLVSGDRYAVVRARPSYADMLALESIPPWLCMPV